MSDNQTSLQLTHDLLSDDGKKITFVLSTAADRCIVAYCPLSNVIKLSELDKFAMIAPNKVLPLIHMNGVIRQFGGLWLRVIVMFGVVVRF